MRLPLALVVAASLGACTHGASNTVLQAASRPRVGSAGVTVTLPVGWHTTAARDGNVVDPLTRVAVSSAPIGDWTRRCQTQVVHYAPRREAVALVVLEWQPSPDARLEPRPRFTDTQMPLRPGELECFAGSGASAFFEDEGRAFGAYILLGERAPRTLADAARGILDSLRVTPKP